MLLNLGLNRYKFVTRYVVTRKVELYFVKSSVNLVDAIMDCLDDRIAAGYDRNPTSYGRFNHLIGSTPVSKIAKARL